MKSKRNGFSSLELIIATVVLVIGLLPVIATIRRVSNGVTDRSSERLTLMYAQSLLEKIRKEEKWDQNTVNAMTLCTPSSLLGPESGETAVAHFNDVDDYHGYKYSPFDGFVSCVTVRYVSLAFADGASTSLTNTPQNFKMLSVTTTQVGPPPVSSTVETIVCNGIEN